MSNLESLISHFNDVKSTVPTGNVGIESLIKGIKDGQWMDEVIDVRKSKTKEERTEAKKTVPAYTVSGTFNARKASELIQHSGFIAIDLDNIENPNKTKLILANDPFTWSCFISISGKGLCAIYKIDPGRHLDSFFGIAKYLLENYNLYVDQSCKDVCRQRFVSHDPEIYHCHTAKVFRNYVPKPKIFKQTFQPIFEPTHFDDIIQEFMDRNINICEHYPDWIQTGFALVSKFGDSGNEYFHKLSSVSGKYNHEICQKVYDNLVKSHSEIKTQVTIATIYYHAKQNNIALNTLKGKEIIRAAASMKKSRVKNINEEVQKFLGYTDPEIVKQVEESKTDIDTDQTPLELAEDYLRFNTNLYRDGLTRFIYNNDIEMNDTELNDLYLNMKHAIPKLPNDLFHQLINSNRIKQINPVFEYFKNAADELEPRGYINKLGSAIISNDMEVTTYFLRKWLVGCVSTWHGEHSPLMFVLAGGQGSGKTEFLRRLLPDALKKYYAESKLDDGKDGEILMTKSLIIMDDEMGGKSKKESKRLKELTSKQTFSIREPYGRATANLRRTAVLCGTTNDMAILNDPTGNRRIIPIEVFDIDKKVYNAIDKDLLWLEIYNLWNEGFEWRLTGSDVELLKGNTEQMVDYSPEYEAIMSVYEAPAENDYEFYERTATEIKGEIEKIYPTLRLSLKKLGMELKFLGYIQQMKKINGHVKKLYKVKYKRGN